MVWYSHLFQKFPQFIVIHTVKGFGIVNKAEIDVFLEFSCCFDDTADVGYLGHFQILAIMNKTTLHINVQVLYRNTLSTPLGKMVKVCGKSMFGIIRIHQITFQHGYTILHLYQQ